jgi:site-specific recombinase XerD
MTAIEWIKQFENYLTVVKNRSLNTVKSYVIDAELLYRFATTGELGQQRVKLPMVENALDWSAFTEDMAVDYVRALKAGGAKDTSTARKIYSLRHSSSFSARRVSLRSIRGETWSYTPCSESSPKP